MTAPIIKKMFEGCWFSNRKPVGFHWLTSTHPQLSGKRKVRFFGHVRRKIPTSLLITNRNQS